MVKSTQVMGAMNRLVKIADISETMQGMQKEMCKVCRPSSVHVHSVSVEGQCPWRASHWPRMLV